MGAYFLRVGLDHLPALTCKVEFEVVAGAVADECNAEGRSFSVDYQYADGVRAITGVDFAAEVQHVDLDVLVSDDLPPLVALHQDVPPSSRSSIVLRSEAGPCPESFCRPGQPWSVPVKFSSAPPGDGSKGQADAAVMSAGPDAALPTPQRDAAAAVDASRLVDAGARDGSS